MRYLSSTFIEVEGPVGFVEGLFTHLRELRGLAHKPRGQAHEAREQADITFHDKTKVCHENNGTPLLLWKD